MAGRKTLRVSISRDLAGTFILWFKDYVECGADLDHLEEEYEAFCQSYRTAIQADIRRERRERVMKMARENGNGNK